VSEIHFDTNIVIDALHNRPEAWAEIRRATRAWISRMTWIEVLAGVPEGVGTETEEFLGLFAMCEIDEEIARRTAAIRHQSKSMKIPDAVILASAQVTGRILVTRNIKYFPANMPGIRVPYLSPKKA
jgi:hypothetical protein